MKLDDAQYSVCAVRTEEITKGDKGRHTATAMDRMYVITEPTRVDQWIQPRKARTVPAL